MEDKDKIPKAILDIVRNDIESRIKIIKSTDDFIQYKVAGYSDVYNIGMIDPNTKPIWFAKFEDNQTAFNKNQMAFNKKIESDIKKLDSKIDANTALIRKYHPE